MTREDRDIQLTRRVREASASASRYHFRALDAMTQKQLQAFQAGALKTKSLKITRWLDLEKAFRQEAFALSQRRTVLLSLELHEGGRLWSKGTPRGQLRLVEAS